ncbi:hypothetical protein THAOC_25410 [Thalassiosira oceanica]|uniref:Uncharacterized protein n=1 Tax=Thalassiosira oceanica TaxID=159749 RepID=K0S1H1_THAOC|nr:hypothetical protein THAOC_25410 [Thalassiosira oceanica]|eukprot:EJK54916.1 hypothetical protein THAOC_25410 [Thalassiosira oceanica]
MIRPAWRPPGQGGGVGASRSFLGLPTYVFLMDLYVDAYQIQILAHCILAMGCHSTSRKTAHASTVTKVHTKNKKNEETMASLGRGEFLHNHKPPSNGGWQHRK